MSDPFKYKSVDSRKDHIRLLEECFLEHMFHKILTGEKVDPEQILRHIEVMNELRSNGM